MKKLTLILLVMVLSIAGFYSCNEPFTDDLSSDELSLKSANVVKSYIVVLNDAELNAELANQIGYEAKQKTAKTAAEKIMKRAGITDGELGFVYGTAIKGFSVKIAPGQLKKLQEDPSVKYIEEDQIITLVQPDVKINAKPGAGAVDQTIPWGISRVGGGGTFLGTNTAWIIDTGIDLDHPDLNVDKAKSKTFVISKSADDDNGHGSHVAGTIGAKNNTIGVIGVAPGAKLVAVKVLTRSGSGTTSSVVAGIDYVATSATSGDVANMSLGGGVSTTLDNAVINAANKGIKFALAAGNESDNANNHSPARVGLNNASIYTISAMDGSDKFAYFSNYGTPVDYCAPGVSIYSCYKDGGYATLNGTSMAAPHAAGLLLLGDINNGGNVLNDPDGKPDVIGVH